MSDKLTKILIVIFLTVLIWAWAFLSQEKKETFHGSLVISLQTDPALLVSFSAHGINYGRQIPLKLNFIGTPAKISELARRTKLAPRGDVQREELAYTYNPEDHQHTQTRTYTFNLIGFLQQHRKTRELALTLESCEIGNKPVEQIQVEVEVLQQQWVPVRCLDENDMLVTDAQVDPPSVELYVRKGSPVEATVRLSREQINRARREPVRVTPFVQVAPGERRVADEPVSVTLPGLSELGSRPFQTTKPIGFIMSQKLQSQYRVVLDADSEAVVRSSVQMLATNEAFEAYQNVAYPLLIEIRDSDASLPTIPPKTVIYNFPNEYMQAGQIKLADPAAAKTRQVNIKLVPLTAPTP